MISLILVCIGIGLWIVSVIWNKALGLTQEEDCIWRYKYSAYTDKLKYEKIRRKVRLKNKIEGVALFIFFIGMVVASLIINFAKDMIK